MSTFDKLFRMMLAAVFASMVNTVCAAPPAAGADPAQAAFSAANAAAQRGPAQVALVGQATLSLPEGYAYVPAKEAIALLKAMGNQPGDSVQGMLVPAKEGGWFMVISYVNAGYIKDDDARNWNADDLITNIREGTEEDNKERKARGIPELEVVGWVEKPQYDAGTQRLMWSLETRSRGVKDDSGVNYNTLVLGREGYMSMNMVTDRAAIEALKPTARQMLAALKFDSGKRYADFDSKTDKIAEYGLAALVAGVAAKKLGLLAVIGVFVAKFAKVLIAAAVVGSGAVFKLLGRRKAEQPRDAGREPGTPE